jgi:hypothetical protein
LAGRDEEAAALLRRALNTFTNQRERIAGIIDGAPPLARAVLQPALESTLRKRTADHVHRPE